MASLVVYYKGQKKAVKVTPMSLMQSVVSECATHFKLDVSNCVLQHKRAVIDNAQPFRFCNISNNSVLDLVVSAAPATKGKASMCRIAISVESSDALSDSFDSSMSLKAILDSFISRGQLPPNFWDRQIELIYMRASYEQQSALEATTLASLGLSG